MVKTTKMSNTATAAVMVVMEREEENKQVLIEYTANGHNTQGERSAHEKKKQSRRSPLKRRSRARWRISQVFTHKKCRQRVQPEEIQIVSARSIGRNAVWSKRGARKKTVERSRRRREKNAVLLTIEAASGGGGGKDCTVDIGRKIKPRSE